MAEKILVIDDEKQIRDLLVEQFKQEGYDVETANNGREGLDKIKQGIHYDCVISDIKMPEMDGIEFLKNSHVLAPALPIIIVSGIATVNLAIEALELGAVSLLEKPFNNKKLLSTVREILSLRSKSNRKQLSLPYLEKKWTFECPGNKDYVTPIIQSLTAGLIEFSLLPPAQAESAKEAFQEALNNAIIHGNKNNLSKRIFINASVKATQMFVTIQDEGDGFNPAQHIDPDLNDKIWEQNKGLHKIFKTAKKVSFNAKGNQIQIYFGRG